MPRRPARRARLAVVRAGERALLVAEHLRLEERVGQRGAVDGLEFRARAAAQLVDHARRDFLARSGRPEDEHGDLGLGGGANPLEDDQHLLVAAHHVAEALDRRRRLLDAGAHGALEQGIDQRAPAAAVLGLEPLVAGADQTGLDEIVQAVLDVLRQPREVLRQRVERERASGRWCRWRSSEARSGDSIRAAKRSERSTRKPGIVAAAIAEPGWFHDMHGGAARNLSRRRPAVDNDRSKVPCYLNRVCCLRT